MAEDPLVAASAALRAADWGTASLRYEALLEADDVGEAHFGQGVARWWLGDVTGSLSAWERAYAAFRREGNQAQAAVAAFYLCLSYRMSMGNHAAANGWLVRASSLVEDHGLEPVAGWVLLARAYSANDDHDPTSAEANARRAVALAREHGDGDLHLCATCELGAALLATGHLDEGGALLDQAMAGAMGGDCDDLDSVVLIACRTITAYGRSANPNRAVQWINAASTFQTGSGSTHLFTTCRTYHGLVLFATGSWERAEAELETALAAADVAEVALRAEAAGALAQLHIAQDRLEEAHRLLQGLEDHPTTVVAQVRLQIARGNASTAAAIARRRLDQLGEHELERFVLLDLLAEAAPNEPRPDTPIDRSATGFAFLCRAHARATLASNLAEGTHHLEEALAAFAERGLTYESARTRALLSHALTGSNPELAIREGRVAFTALDRLGATREADELAAHLRSMGARVARSAPKGLPLLTQRERQVLGLLEEGLSNRTIAERLFISRRTVEQHVSTVLRKLGLETRAEAAAFAARSPSPQK